MLETETLLIGINVLILVIISSWAFAVRRSQGNRAKGTVDSEIVGNKAKLFDIMVEHAPCAVTAISPTYQVLMVNKITTTISGVTKDAALGRRCYEVFGEGTICLGCPVAEALTTATTHKRTKQERNHHGAVKYIEQTAVPVLAGNGSVSYVLEFTLDITEKIELEQQNQHLAVETVTSLAKLIGSRDQYTGVHSARVKDIALAIGKELELAPDTMSELAIAAVLHDIGKIGIPEQILNKTGKLTESEFTVIQKHPQLGYDALINIEQLEKVAEYILYHHECYDGRGYPSRKRGQDIPFVSRILSVADVYEAITSDRVYRKAMNLDQTLMVMRAGRGSKFDPEILDAFFRVLARERPDAKQYLNDNEAV
ncbi:HD domain-containing phosphohydrolase [Sporomusa malonica]|uniref:PAS domain S-box-containing protein n=1 Tax=Sporomusa malonica TaxID=112901 RepID=A0A1W2EJY1_9FIRM|nr:HD domain-containing phosphohydrolase [Sporomusa malonica]SMD09915.1 PAS domain S-box-containing protein [Sporomusa malonica]